MLEASRLNYDACVAHVDHALTCAGVTATMRMHHLKFDANGQPRVGDLTKCLVEHAIVYAIAARNRPESMTPLQAARYTQEARKLFRVVRAPADTADLSGEAGEMLLYFLLETVLGAPQVVAKAELKTNPGLEVNGSDGIHMRWDPKDQVVDVFFGESKLYIDVSAALTAAFASIEKFHADGMREHELSLVTKHFKGADPQVRAAVTDLLEVGRPGSGVRVNHACLIGYDWTAFAQTPALAAAEIEKEYRKHYLADAPRLHGMLQHRFNACQRKQFRFEVFFLPFVSVQSFRDAFYAAIE